MRIHEFEAEERLLEIKLHFLQVSQIKESLADHRDKYRSLSMEIEINQDSILKCCDFFERSLLINCYTFSEQLVKNFVYAILEKDTHSNSFLNCFINTKIPEDKFSPNAKFSDIERLVKGELYREYKFTLGSNRNCFKVYDEMIKSRHTYAHSGIYNFDFNNFDLVIQTLEFLYYELNMPLEKGISYREKYQKTISEIKKLILAIDKIYNKNSEFDSRAYGRNLNNLKSRCYEFNTNYSDSLKHIIFLKPIVDKIIEIGNSDLRSKQCFIQKVVLLKNDFLNTI